ncbi:unnamed protein product [marine sediment metagenome]|uniref:Antitoxin n=1 Tax=marine sediment metagenome TaxID=412755 RepID=X0ZHD8_9ZZZZ
MSLATNLLKASHIGIRNFKKLLSTKLLDELIVITNRGTPVSVNIPYSDALELIDILDELADLETISAVEEARKAIRSGVTGIPVSDLFNRIRKKR